MTSVDDGIGQQIAKASGWSVSSRFLIRSIGLVSTAILARLLVPEDFGLIAMAMVVYQIIEVLGEFNFNLILLVERDAGKDYYDTVWTLSVIRGVVMAVVLLLLAAPMARFFEEPRVQTIMYFLACVAVLGSTENVGIIEFQKHFRFGRDFAFSVIAKVCSFVTVVTAALLLRSYVALLLGMFATAASRVALSFALHPYRPRPDLARWREVIEFSRWLLAANIMRTLYRRADAFFISKLAGAGPLGIYSVAFELASVPGQLLIMPVHRALLPGFARLAAQPERLRKLHADSFALIMLVVLPVAVGMALTADPLVRLLLGERWLDVIPLLRVLAFVGCLRALSSNIAPLFLALNKPHMITLLAGIIFVFGTPLIGFGTWYGGVLGAAYAITAAGVVNTVATFALANRLLGIRIRRVLAPVWRSALATLVMCLPVYWFGSLFGQPPSNVLLFAKLLTQVIVGAVSFVGVLLSLWWLGGAGDGPERTILRTVNTWRPQTFFGR